MQIQSAAIVGRWLRHTRRGPCSHHNCTGIVQTSVESALRKENSEILARTIAKMKFSELGQDITAHKLQNIMKKSLDKIYPLKMYEFNALKLATGKNDHKHVVPVTAEEAKPAKASKEDVEEIQEEAPVKEVQEE